MMVRRKFRTKEARRRERIRLALKACSFFCGVVLVIGAVVYLGRLENLRINTVYVDTDGVLSETEIAAVIKSELSKSYFGLLPKNFALFPTPVHLEEIIATEFPRVRTIVLVRAGIKALDVSVTEREPEALWCGDVVPSIAQKQTSEESREDTTLWGSCYLMDEDSFIYAKAPIYSGDVFPRYYGSLLKAEPLGQHYLPKEEFTQWQVFYHSLTHENTLPHAILFADERDAEVYLSNGVTVLVPRYEDIGVIQRRLISVLDSDTIDYSRPVEYVDMRFGDKAFVKYGDEPEAS